MASDLIQLSEGVSPDGEYHNWQTVEELRQLYQQRGLSIEGCYPVRQFPVQIERTLLKDSTVNQVFEPLHRDDSTFMIPTYLFVMAQKPA